MSYYKRHIFFCTNLREDGRQCCQEAGATEARAYAKQTAPLNRVMFSPGDTVLSHEGWNLTVTSVQENNGLLTYYGHRDDGTLALEHLHEPQLVRGRDPGIDIDLGDSPLQHLVVQTVQLATGAKASPTLGFWRRYGTSEPATTTEPEGLEPEIAR